MYQKKIKENNEKKVFHYIYKKQLNLSIAEISHDLNISFPTVKNILNKFLKQTIIKEDLKMGGGAGRKTQYYSLEKNFVYSIGISINSNSLIIILINERGEIIKKIMVKDNFFQENLLEKIDELLEEFFNEIDSSVIEKIIGIGIAVPGIVDTKHEIIEITPLLRLSLSKLKDLSARYTKKILIDNEANLCALSEKFLGIGKDFSNFITLNIDETVNMSTFTEESVYGEFFFKAARVNHMIIEKDGLPCECGNKGCWGKYISEDILLEKNRLKEISSKTLEEYITNLSLGIKNIIFLYNPEKIIISGKICEYKSIFEETLLNKIYNNNIFFKGVETIQFSTHSNKGKILGAAMLPIVDELF